ncbi:alkylation response protein AidB-like acyl-CoA dehydrogenase [Salinibacterium sp. CAN_S4]|uniref:acyl-CoA dehydrogenase n=1 Tax=Salinibacterium sp. CAN_S4 TaxID=2787727 RepID=UPI001A1BF695
MHVSLSPVPQSPGPLTSAAVVDAPRDVDAALALALRLGLSRPVPGDASTRDLWEAFATLGAADLGVVRAVEPHLDAIGILAQAGIDPGDGIWGVFAAEGGDDPLTTSTGDAPSLSGTKPWCSLADRLDSALVTATTSTGHKQLYAVDLKHHGVRVAPATWMARGLSEIPSGPVTFGAVPATPVGEPGWYLERPGFAFGGIGVAACWFGGAVGIGRTVHAAATAKPNPFLLAHLGAIDELLHSSRRALLEATQLVGYPSTDGRLLAKRVRARVAKSCEEIIERAGHALGPAPLALDGAHAKRVADLQLYIRQHHAERDDESLGRALAGGPAPW